MEIIYIEEALKCLNERLSQELHGVKKYCENTTLNAAITHYLAIAEKRTLRLIYLLLYLQI